MRDVDYEVVLTTSGAPAMYDRTACEVMHPVAGPLAEAVQLYAAPSQLEQRLLAGGEDPLVLLDVGLGAGSNGVAAWNVSERLPETARKLELVSFDRTLEALRLAVSEQHGDAFGFGERAREAARGLLAERSHRTARTHWRLCLDNLLDDLAREPAQSADIVFWDPYSPRVNPALWSLTAFSALRRVCRDGATLHTFSAATSTRSALLLAGFAVGFGGASAGKQSQTTIAATHVSQLAEPLDSRWLARLARSHLAFPADAPSDALERVRQLPQFAEGRSAP
jgi:queuine tRNA-ribosyltransferase